MAVDFEWATYQALNHQVSEHPEILSTKLNPKRGAQCTTGGGVIRDQASSWMQKATRKGAEDQVRKALIELDLMKAMEFPGTTQDELIRLHPDWSSSKTTAKASRTIMANRLVVIVPEDIGMGSPLLPAVVQPLHLQWLRSRDDPVALLTIARLEAEAPKIRLISSLKTAFMLPPFYWDHSSTKLVAKTRMLRLWENMKPAFPAIFGPTHTVIFPGFDVLGGCPADVSISDKKKAIVAWATEKKLGCFAFLGRLILDTFGDAAFEKGKEAKKAYSTASRSAIRQMDAILGDLRPLLADKPLVTQSFDVLRTWMKEMTHGEKFIYGYQAILLVLFRDGLGHLTLPTPSAPVTMGEVDAAYKAHILQEVDLTVPDYVVDKHTAAGRKKKANVVDFATKGAAVANEATAFVNPDLKAMYDLFKVAMEVDGVMPTDTFVAILADMRRGVPLGDIFARLKGSKAGDAPKEKKRRHVQAAKATKPKEKEAENPKRRRKTSQSIDDDTWYAFLGAIGVKEEKMRDRFLKVIDDGFHAQKLTGKAKKHTYVGKDYIVKGPYERSRGLILNLAFTALMDTLDPKATLEVKRLIVTPLGYYLVWKNVGEFDPEAPHIRPVDAEGMNAGLKVLERGSFIDRMADLDTTTGITKKQAIGTLTHLYYRGVLGIGDSGPHNVLVRRDKKDRVVGIDMEETRGEQFLTPDDPWIHLSKRISYAQSIVYHPYLQKIRFATVLPPAFVNLITKLNAIFPTSEDFHTPEWYTERLALINHDIQTKPFKKGKGVEEGSGARIGGEKDEHGDGGEKDEHGDGGEKDEHEEAKVDDEVPTVVVPIPIDPSWRETFGESEVVSVYK